MPIITKLNAKSQSYSVGSGGVGALSSSDVAAATTGLDKLQEALLYVCCLGQYRHAYVRWLRDQVENELVSAYKLAHGDAVRLAPVLIEDLCCGHRKRSDRDMATGYDNETIASKLSVSRRTFGRKWQNAYKGVISRYEFIINQLNTIICKKLGDELIRW